MKLKKYIIENYATIALWVMLFFVIWIQAVPQTESVLEVTLFVTCLIALSFPFTRYLSENLLQKAIKKKKTTLFVLQFLLFSVIIGAIFLALLFFFAFLEKQGFFPFSDYFDMNIPPSMLFIPISAGVIINACVCGVRFFEENTKLKKTLVEYQLRTLQHQVTPHFMFNVLNHIHILMQTDVDLASDLLIKYSEILRYQLYNGDKDKVSLEQDIQFLKDFIAVEKVRWENKLTVTCSWKVENAEIEIPALLFITLVENAFKHVSKSDFEKGYINIDFLQKENLLQLEVENSKSILPKKKNNFNGLGLKNIKERLDILFYGNYSLSIEETENIYLTKLTINLQK
ncbi:MAG: histidine kinase [Dysgonomonas sp.]|nr:histidine kinase [Dysgonomonas sp.]